MAFSINIHIVASVLFLLPLLDLLVILLRRLAKQKITPYGKCQTVASATVVCTIVSMLCIQRYLEPLEKKNNAMLSLLLVDNFLFSVCQVKTYSHPPEVSTLT